MTEFGPLTAADRAVLAWKELNRNDRLMIAVGDMGEAGYARVKLGKLLEEAGPDVRFRALFEGWDWERLVREMY